MVQTQVIANLHINYIIIGNTEVSVGGILYCFNQIVTVSTTGIWLDFFKRRHKRMRNAAFKGRMTRGINDFQFGFVTPFRR